MDDIGLLHQGQFWLVTQVCFTKYELAIQKGASHNDAYAIAKETLDSYLRIIEQFDTPSGKELSEHVLRFVDALIGDVPQKQPTN